MQSPKLAFIGSGPLPLTSLCILDIFPSAYVHNIDRDPSALSISKSLSAELGYAGRMSFACVDVSVQQDEIKDATKWNEFDVVFLAALVGMDTISKLAILQGLATRMKPGTLLVVRSAKGLRGVLYPVCKARVYAWNNVMMLMADRYSNSGMTWRVLGWRYYSRCIRGPKW